MHKYMKTFIYCLISVSNNFHNLTHTNTHDWTQKHPHTHLLILSAASIQTQRKKTNDFTNEQTIDEQSVIYNPR